MGLFDDLGIGFKAEDFLEAARQAEEEDPMEDAIWTRPVVRRPKVVCYEHAQDFARALTIDGGTETFAYVAGGFVFGDFLEALVEERRISVRRLGMQMLSLNDENIDSLRNVVEMCGTERLDLVLSGYWFATEMRKGGLVGYLFDQLDLEGLELHVAIAEMHCKVVTVETWAGNHLTMSGSANLRSSNSVEQIHITPDDGLFEFCDGVTQRIIGAYDVLRQEKRKYKARRLGGKRLWQAVQTPLEAEAAEAGAGEAAADAVETRRGAARAKGPSASASRARGPRADGPTYTARCPSSGE